MGRFKNFRKIRKPRRRIQGEQYFLPPALCSSAGFAKVPGAERPPRESRTTLSTMTEEFKILIVEDSANDAELILRVLAKPDLQCVPCVVSNPLEFRRALAGTGPDLILSDYAMTGWDGMQALGIARELRPGIPFIFVSGAIGEEKVVEALQSGATDYVSKNNLHRLPNVINRAINEGRERTGRQEAEEKLRQSHERFESVIASLRDVVWSIAVPSRELLYISLSMMTVYGHIIDEFYRGHVLWGDLIHPEDRKRVVAEWEEAMRVGFFDCQHRILLPTGEVRWIHNRGQGAYDNTGRVMRIDGVAMDSTEQHEQEEKIARLSRIHAVLIRISSSMLRFRDREGLFKEACQVAVEAGLFKMAWIGVIDPETLDGKPVAWAGAEDGFMQLTRLTARTGVPESERPGNRALREGRPIICNDIKTDAGILAVRPDALARGYRSLAAFPLFVGRQPIGVLALFAAEPDFFDEEEIKLLTQLSGDISFALEYIDKEERLNYLAHYDPLTGLPNRTLFLDRLTQTLNMAKYADAKVFVAIGDIRRFRRVNSTFGKQAGDTLLREFAGRLNDLWPDKDGIARVSGDAFAGFLPEGKKPSETAFWFDRELTPMLNKPFKVNEQEITVALTAGIAVYPTDGTEADTLFRNAEAALRRAKISGEKYMFYQPEMTAKFEEMLLLESKLRQAIEQEQFVLHYQPKVDVGNRSVTGLEALLRWNQVDLFQLSRKPAWCGRWDCGRFEKRWQIPICGEAMALSHRRLQSIFHRFSCRERGLSTWCVRP